jgi:hypothetical protein
MFTARRHMDKFLLASLGFVACSQGAPMVAAGPDEPPPSTTPPRAMRDTEPDEATPSASSAEGGDDARTSSKADQEPPVRAAICPTLFAGRAETLALLATDGETAKFVASNGAELELPFAAPSAQEISSDRHVALFSPGTSWDLAVLSRDGAESYHAEGAFSEFHDNFRTREVWLADDGTLTADYVYEGHDFTSAGAVSDLVVTPPGTAREVVIADLDDEGYTPFAHGLAHVASAELLELPDRGALVVHVERDGRWLAAQLHGSDSEVELVVLEGAETTTHPLGPGAEWPARLVPVGSEALVVLTQLGSSVPLWHFDLATERATPLVDVDQSEGLLGHEDGTSYVLRNGSDLELRFLVDVETAMTVDVAELALPAATAVVTGRRSWFLLASGAPVTTVDRLTGRVSAIDDASALDHALALGDRLYLVVGGRLSSFIDLVTNEPLPLATDDVLIDDLIGIGDWVVGLRGGAPALRLAPGSTISETIDAPPSSVQLTHDVLGDWLVFRAAGRPLWAMSSTGATSRFAPADRAAVEPADYIDVQGDWAFGFTAGDDATAGMGTLVWRANLRDGLVEAIAAPAGYDVLFDRRYREPGAEDSAVASFAMQATDLGHADGTVTVVRRDAASSFVLRYGHDASWRVLGDPMPGVWNLRVTAGNGFFLVERAEWNCFCPAPELSWEPSDASAPVRQLVLTSREPFEVLRQEPDQEGSVAVDGTQSCVAWNNPIGSLVIDGPTGARAELGSAGNFRWLDSP